MTITTKMTDEKKKTGIERLLSSISLSSFIHGFENYRTTWVKVMRFRGKYYSQSVLDLQVPTLGSAFFVYLYGVALCFAVYVPIIIFNGVNLSKLWFLLQYLYLQCLCVLLIHVSAKCFFGKGTLEKTAIVYFVFSGIFSPIFMFIDSPCFFHLKIVDFVGLPSLVNNMKFEDTVRALPTWIRRWNYVAFLLMLLVAYIMAIRWVADVHQITRKRLIVSMCFIFFPLMLIHNLFIAPFVAEGIRIISEMLAKVV